MKMNQGKTQWTNQTQASRTRPHRMIKRNNGPKCSKMGHTAQHFPWWTKRVDPRLLDLRHYVSQCMGEANIHFVSSFTPLLVLPPPPIYKKISLSSLILHVTLNLFLIIIFYILFYFQYISCQLGLGLFIHLTYFP